MANPVLLEASVACANLVCLEADLEQLTAAGVDLLHIDIMDGRFVENFCLDFSIMRAIQSVCKLPMDCHLMVEEPERYIDRAIASGASYVCVHFEAGRHVQRTLKRIRDAGARSGIALNPATPIHNLDYILEDLDMVTIMTVNPGFAGQQLVAATLRKIADVRRMLESSGNSQVRIQVDGNVSFDNIPVMVSAGANMLVGGTSSVFHRDYSIAQAVERARALAENCECAQ